MAYSTETDVEVRFPLLVACPDDTITALILQEDAEIDKILAGMKYVVPVVTPDAFLKKWSVYKAGLASWNSIDATAQHKAFNSDEIWSWLERIEAAVANGEMKFAYPKYTNQPSVSNDSLNDPSFSNFSTDVDVRDD